MAQMHLREERSLGELFGELSEETSMLIHQEMQLAKVELTQKVTQVGKNVAFLAVGGMLAYTGFLVLMAALVIILAEFMAGWLAALLVGLLLAVISYFVIQQGISALKHFNPLPERTIESLKEDQEWLKRQMS